MRRVEAYRVLLVVVLLGVAQGCNCKNEGDDSGTDAGGADSGTDAANDAGGSDAGSDAGADAGLPTTPPTTVTMVVNSGFREPTDAVSSPDGATFYFAAYTDVADPQAAIFSVPSDGTAAASALHTGAPFEYPTGLVLSCDGATLYVADMGSDEGASGDGGNLYSMSTSGVATPTLLTSTGIGTPTGLALGADCATLYVTGWDDANVPAAFSLATGGGAATVIASGSPLRSPTGVHVDDTDVLWVLDHLADGPDGEGVLFSIPAATGVASVVVSGVALGAPGGVSLVAGGGTAVIATRDAAGAGVLLTVEIGTGTTGTVATPAMDPAGLRTARAAGVFAVADSEGGAIYRAE